MPKLIDIARDLDVSVSLVSKVLNGRVGRSGASESTIQRIQRRAQQLGYHRNPAAAALVTGRSNVLGVLIHPFGEPGTCLSESTLLGVVEEAQTTGQRLLLHYYRTSDEFLSYVGRMHRNTVDGVVLAGLTHWELAEDVVRMQQRGLAVVTVHDVHETLPGCLNVGIDQMAVTRLATEHLIKQGCRRIAHVTTVWATARRKGYEQALSQAGMPLIPELVFPAQGFSLESGEQAAKAWLAAGTEFDGIVAQSDHMAMGATNVLLAAGRRVPADVKVIGVDDAPFCSYLAVPLSSVSQECFQRGRLAVRLLLDKLEGKTVDSVTVDPVLKVRRSSEPIPSSSPK